MIKYRRPEIGEAHSIATLHLLCWREAYFGLVPDSILERANVDERADRWRGFLRNPNSFIEAAWDIDMPIGFVSCGPPHEPAIPEGFGQIGAIYIAAQYHRRGIGRRLMSDAAKDWRNRGGDKLALTVLAENAEARAFYEKLGGKILKTGTHDWDGYQMSDAVYGFDDLNALVVGKD